MEIYDIICGQCGSDNFKYIETKCTCQNCGYILTGSDLSSLLNQAFVDHKRRRLEEITARCEAATLGPWEYIDNGFDGIIYDAEGHCVTGGEPDEGRLEPDDPNTVFIAHSRSDIPWLLEQLADRDAEIKKLKHALDGKDTINNLYAATVDMKAEQREQLDAKITALEKALNGCCWACAKAKLRKMHQGSFANISTCGHRKHPGGGRMRGCLNWAFDQARYAETQEG